MPIVAAIQAGPLIFDLEATLAKTLDKMEEAAGAGAVVALFPEAFLGGYPKGHSFGASVGVRTPEGRREFRRYFESAIQVPGPATATLGDACARLKLHLIIGVIERDGGTLYCTVLFFDGRGHLLGKHRKVMPTAVERLIWGFGDGSTLSVFATPAGRTGAVICWENYMPLLRTAMYAKGIELYCAPTVDDRDSWQPTMRHIATEGRCYVISACQLVPEGITAGIRGGSVIVDPLGNVLAGPIYGEEGILTAEIDPGRIAEAKYDLDVVGHYARPDIFQLTIDEQPKLPVGYDT
jgi:nitrilase